MVGTVFESEAISPIFQKNIKSLHNKLPVFFDSFVKASNDSQNIRYGSYLKRSPHVFFKSMKSVLEVSQSHKQQETPLFNPFTVLGIEKRELAATALWSDLLNPKGRHEQGHLFLKPFLELIDFKVQSKTKNFSSYAEVKPVSCWSSVAEFFVLGVQEGDKNGKVDVYLEHEPSKSVIAIEYKINAKDQDKQVRRYHDHLEEKNYENHQVVYIHPTGNIPSDNSLDGLDSREVVCISIQFELVGILKKILRENNSIPNQIRMFIEYYIEVAKR